MDNHIGGYKNIDAFVKAKTDKLREAEKNFRSLFELTFSEESNIMWEESRGFKIYKFTYGEVKAGILKLAPKIRASVAEESGTRVGLALPNSLEWIECFWGILAAGYNPVLVNTRLGADIIERTLKENGVRTLITAEGAHPLSPDTGLGIIDVKDFQDDKTANLPSDSAKPDFKEASDAKNESEAANLPSGFGEDVFVMSSGTSSHVKFCAYGAEEIIAQILDSSAIIKDCREIRKHYEGELKQLCLLPFCHIFGLTAVFLWFSFFSRCFVKLNDLSAETVQSTIRRHKVTHVFAVPLFWEKTYEAAINGIRERGEKTAARFEKGMKISRALDFCPPLRSLFTKIAFKELRREIFGDTISFTICGGSTVSADVIEFFNRIGYPLANGYGMSEIGITSVELRKKVRFSVPLSVGCELASVKYRIGDNSHLQVNGESLAKYIVCEGRRQDRAEWFDTGDFAAFDAENQTYTIEGRSDELVIGRSGENLNPVFIEGALENTGADRTCLCSVSENGRNISLLIVSYNKFLSAAAVMAVKENVRNRLEKLGLLSQIEKYVFTGTPLLLEDDFKLNRRRIAKRYEAGEFEEAGPAQADNVTPGDEMQELIRSAFAAVLHRNASEIADDADFFTDLGGSSFDWYSMIKNLSGKLGVNLGQAPAGTTTVSKMRAAAEALLEKTAH